MVWNDIKLNRANIDGMTYGYMKENNKKYFYVSKTYKTQLTLKTQVHIMLQVHISTHLTRYLSLRYKCKNSERNNTVYSAIDTSTNSQQNT